MTCVAAPRQQSVSVIRERTGLGLRTKVGRGNMSLSEEGRAVLREVSKAGDRGDWHQVRKLFATYKGREIQIFTAVMHIALKCRKYKDGSQVYEKVCNMNIEQTAPTYVAALKIFAKMQQPDRVKHIWAQAQKNVQTNVVLAAARIDAAAMEGDVEAAATVLDYMNKTGIPIDIGHINSAIRACWGSDGCSHNAAKYLFQLLLDLELQPDIVTFTCVIGALKTAPLEDALTIYTRMKNMDIEANEVFAEIYLVTVLRKPQAAAWSMDDLLRTVLPAQPPERVAAASAALAEFKAAGVDLSTLSARIGLALKRWAEKRGLGGLSLH